MVPRFWGSLVPLVLLEAKNLTKMLFETAAGQKRTRWPVWGRWPHLDPATEHQESRPLKRLLHGVYEKGNFLYNFKGLEFTKSRFRGDTFKTYCCYRRTIPALEFLAMFKLTRLL